MSAVQQHVLSAYWDAAGPCWLCVPLPVGVGAPAFEQALRGLGLEPLPGAPLCYARRVDGVWDESWRLVSEAIRMHGAAVEQAAVVPGDAMPTGDVLRAHLQPCPRLDALASHLWLGDALHHDRFTCFFQTIVDRKRTVVGYESFARVIQPGGAVVGGEAIIEASRALGIQHLVDRCLHDAAVRAYSSGELIVPLFINCISGFIHRSAVYFAALDDAVAKYRVPPEALVLEITRAEHARDLDHLGRIVEHCQSRGYRFSLDDIASEEALTPLLRQMKPDFIKLDRTLTCRYDQPAALDEIRRLIDAAHRRQCAVVAEGIENEAAFTALTRAGADFFQGFLFSRPAPLGEA